MIGEYVRGDRHQGKRCVVVSKRLQREWMERTQHQKGETKSIKERVQQLTEKRCTKQEASTTGGTYNKTTARHDV